LAVENRDRVHLQSLARAACNVGGRTRCHDQAIDDEIARGTEFCSEHFKYKSDSV
jgi:hypothetical protein